MFAIIKDNEVIKFPILNLRREFPNSSFPVNLTDDNLPEGVVKVHVAAAPVANFNQKVVQANPTFDGEKWVQTWNVISLTDTEYTEKLIIKESVVREERNSLLEETVDKINAIRWETMSEEQRNLWRNYRQALLDIPQQEGFPLEVIWPGKPTL